MKVNTEKAQPKMFKDLEVCSYFIWENKIWQKMTKTKIREFGGETDFTLRKNVQVWFLGLDISDFLIF